MAKSALEYHRQTSYDRYKMKGQGLDWANQPSVFKTYPGLKTVPLPRVKARSKENLSSVIREGSKANAAAKLTLDRLARIILLAHSVTAEVRHGDTQFYYRNVASAGALYPFELYVGARNISGLEHGLYHHSIGLHALTLLRPGNIMPALSSALERGKNSVPVLIFVLTSIFFRSSWKYRDRAYRYSLLDTGHLAENLSLALTAEELPWSLYYDFDDAMVNNLLGVDPRREGCLAVVCVWGEDVSDTGEEPQDLKPSDQGLPDASRVSARETNYTLIRQIHTSSSRVVEAVQGAPMLDHLGLKMEPAKQISKADEWPEVMNYAEAVLRRRSRRNFVPTEVSAQVLDGMLDLLCSTCDQRGTAGLIVGNAISVGFLAGNVQGLDPGFYMLNRGQESMARVSQGSMIHKMAHICLNQAWLAHCALHFVFLSNLEILERTWGTRGYRYAMLMAGRLGQRLYLGATAIGLGCCGIGAFFDDEAAKMLKIKDQAKLLYLVAAGPVKQ